MSNDRLQDIRKDLLNTYRTEMAGFQAAAAALLSGLLYFLLSSDSLSLWVRAFVSSLFLGTAIISQHRAVFWAQFSRMALSLRVEGNEMAQEMQNAHVIMHTQFQQELDRDERWGPLLNGELEWIEMELGVSFLIVGLVTPVFFGLQWFALIFVVVGVGAIFDGRRRWRRRQSSHGS